MNVQIVGRPSPAQASRPQGIPAGPAPLSVTLDAVQPVPIQSGGYRIVARFSRPFLPQSVWRLQVWGRGGPAASFWVTVPKQPITRTKDDCAYAIVNQHTLIELLKGFADKKLWEQTVWLRLAVWEGQGWTFSANSVALRTPVRPVPVRDETLASDQEMKLRYPLRDKLAEVPDQDGTVALKTVKVPDGRRLYNVAAGPALPPGMHFFVSTRAEDRGHFETDPEKRGFDCVSFVMSITGIPSNVNVGKGDRTNSGEAVAEHLGAVEVLHHVDHGALVEHLSSLKDPAFTALILAYNDVGKLSNHIVYYRGGTVYEFQNPRFAPGMELRGSGYGGYATPVSVWRRGYRKTRYGLWAWTR